MGCLSSQPASVSDEIEEEKNCNKKLELAPHLTDTYDPGNMSITHESVMADYKFTKKQATKNIGFRLKSTASQIKLSKITAPTEENQNEEIKEFNSRYIKEKNIKELCDVNLLSDEIPPPHKRSVFISIVQLNACIDIVPPYILEESIFCFKAERSWFFPSNSVEEKQSLQSIRHKVNFNSEFLRYLNKKDSNGLILWLQDDKTWDDISNELTKINDLYFGNASTYKPLLLNEEWWSHNFKENMDGIHPLYCHAYDVIVEEISVCKLKFNPAMEILYQSNPTLIPMRAFNLEMYINQHYKRTDDEAANTPLLLVNDASDLSDKKPYTYNYNMSTLIAVESNTNTNINANTHIINEYSITAAPSNQYLGGIAKMKSLYSEQDDDANILKH